MVRLIKMKDICKCDVKNKELLALFRAKLQLWKEQLVRETDHSIHSQMELMLWDDRVFYPFYKAYEKSEKESRNFKKKHSPSEGIPESMINLWERCYIEKQHMAIRRLIDKDPSRKGSFSLFVLLNDIENHKHLFTRENYVCYDGIPYDENSTSEDKVAGEIAYRHIKFDELSAKSNHNRSRNDNITPEYFRKLKDKFGTFERLTKVADKFIAHAASINNKHSDIRYKDIEEILKEFDKCYKNLICITKTISVLIDEVFIPMSVPKKFRPFDGITTF